MPPSNLSLGPRGSEICANAWPLSSQTRPPKVSKASSLGSVSFPLFSPFTLFDLAQLSSDALLEGGEALSAASPSHSALTKELLLLATELLHALEHAVPERDGATRDMGQRVQNLAQQAATLGGQPRHQQMQPQGDAENGSAPRRVLQADQPKATTDGLLAHPL